MEHLRPFNPTRRRRARLAVALLTPWTILACSSGSDPLTVSAPPARSVSPASLPRTDTSGQAIDPDAFFEANQAGG